MVTNDSHSPQYPNTQDADHGGDYNTHNQCVPLPQLPPRLPHRRPPPLLCQQLEGRRSSNHVHNTTSPRACNMYENIRRERFLHHRSPRRDRGSHVKHHGHLEPQRRMNGEWGVTDSRIRSTPRPRKGTPRPRKAQDRRNDRPPLPRKRRYEQSMGVETTTATATAASSSTTSRENLTSQIKRVATHPWSRPTRS